MAGEEGQGQQARNVAHPLKRHVAAVIAGNALEFYDFITYAFFAVYIGRAFFPAGDAASSLLLSLATFGAGFITRPIGGVVIGSLGDRVGRARAMVLSFSLMGVAILGMVFTPPYAAIGVAAPLLILFFRLLQGFALGGEVGPATAFLVEAPPAEHRGFYGSLQAASQSVAVIAAGLASTGLAAVLDEAALADWGWRVVFFLGALVIPFALIVRRSLPETLHRGGDDSDNTQHDISGLLKAHLRVVVCGLLMLAGATIAIYVVLFLPTYGLTTLGLPPAWCFGATLAIGVFGTIAAPLGGALSDRIGRRPVMIAATLATMALTVPLFLFLERTHSGLLLVVTGGLLSFIFASGGGVMIMTVTESLPRRVRSGVMATLYALAIAIFGGTTQFNIAFLSERLHLPAAPAYYMTAAVVVAFFAVLAMPESAPVRKGTLQVTAVS
jgi:MFS family permease